MRPLCLVWFAIYAAVVLILSVSNHPIGILIAVTVYLFGTFEGPRLLGDRWPYWSRFKRVPHA